jgi:hypothetical protein
MRSNLLTYPNPSRDFCRFQFPENNIPTFPQTCVITDQTGRTVATQTLFSENDNVWVSQLPAGIYQLRAGQFAAKIVK